MKTIVAIVCVLAAVFCGTAYGRGPCRNGRCYAPQQTTRAYTTYSPEHAGSTATAQGVAEMQASRGYMGHFGGNSGYEGVGMGSSPEEALSRCCYSRSGMAVVDQGVAQGRNGKWYACKRYR